MSTLELNVLLLIIGNIVTFAIAGKELNQLVRMFINEHPIYFVTSVLMSIGVCFLGWFGTLLLVLSTVSYVVSMTVQLCILRAMKQ